MGDLAPPAAPKEEGREGFFSKWLKKVKENPLSPTAKLPSPSMPTEEYEAPEDTQPLDLEAIRSKLGIEEEKVDFPVLEGKKEEETEVEEFSKAKEVEGALPEEGKSSQVSRTEERMSLERRRRNEKRNEADSVSPWTMDSPDEWLLTDKQNAQNLLSSAPQAEKEEQSNQVNQEPPREVQIVSMPKQEELMPTTYAESEGEKVEKKQPEEAENEVLIRELAEPAQEEFAQEKNPVSEPQVPKRELVNIPHLVNEHFEGIGVGIKAIQEEVKKIGMNPQPIQVENMFAKEAIPDKHFILKSGERVASLKELMEKLDSMSEEVFRAHVTENKNDFANWIKDVLEQKRLSEEVQPKKEKEELLALLKEEEAQVQSKLTQEKAKVEVEHLDLERKQVELERAKERFDALKVELENKEKEWETFKQRLIQDIQANLTDGVSKALVNEQQKLEQEKIRLAGLQNKVEVRLKALEKDRQALAEERKSWEAERMVLESLRAKESIVAQKEAILIERERVLKEKEVEVKAMQSTLKEALSNSSISFSNAKIEKIEEKPSKKKGARKTREVEEKKEDSQNVPGEEELRSLEEQIIKKMKAPKSKEEGVTFDLRKLDVDQLEERKNKGFASKDELEQRSTHCRKLIDQGNLESAKEEYNRIKDLFARASLDPQDKSLIYNSIRELYNDIHLALLA